MYLIAKQTGGYQAIPIKTGDKWDFRKLLVEREEVRIILRVRGRQYLIHHTREVPKNIPASDGSIWSPCAMRSSPKHPSASQAVRNTSSSKRSQPPRNAATSGAGVTWG